jgi:2-succinyl-5-enolpyruvyl-6-hydroxy-3-cyclohexene-1-carboxylate synthase
MKITFAAITTLFLSASMVSAALEPRATMVRFHPLLLLLMKTEFRSWPLAFAILQAPQHNKRGKFSDGLDLSAILADPSSYLAAASKAFKNPKYASEFAKATANPKFEKSLSKELVSQFGSKTASIALQQYTAIAQKAENKKNSSTQKSKGEEGVAATFSSATAALAKATSSSANWEAKITSAVVGDILGSQTSGTTSTFVSLTIMGSAITLGAAVVLAAL